MAVTLDIGASVNFATVLTSGGQSMRFVATSCGNGCDIGSLAVTPDSGQTTLNFTFVPVDNGSGLYVLQNNRSGNGVSAGTAALQ